MRFQFIAPELETPDQNLMPPASYIRKEFSLNAAVQRAVVHMTALGVYQGYCNGDQLDDSLFNPGFTDYKSRLQYQTYDITDKLHVGSNVIAAVLGDGWYRGCLSINNNRCFFGDRTAFACILELTDASGTHLICSDETWMASQDGPLLQNDMKNMERVDARKELSGWTEPGFDDRAWHSCIKAEYAGSIIPQEGEKITEHEVFVPTVLHTPNGETVLDFEQNHAGHIEFTVSGQAGHTVTLTMGETLDEHGNFTMKNLVTEGSESFAKPVGQQLVYTLKAGTQTYRPQFLVSGHRYVKLENWPEEVKPENFRSIAIYSDLKELGSFSCSNGKINRLLENISWSRKSNFLDIPTDCPTRERAGWTGDINVFSESACYMTDPRKFLKKWLRDFVAGQTPDGRFMCIIPNNTTVPMTEYAAGSAGWSDAIVTIPMMLYRFFGDTEGIEIVYEAAGKYIENNLKRAKKKHIRHWLKFGKHWDYILDTGFHYGEWLEPGTTPISAGVRAFLAPDHEVATAWMYHAVCNYAEMAEILHKETDAAHYREISVKIRDAYRKVFLKDSMVHSKQQCRYVRPVSLGLANDEEKAEIVAALARLCQENDYRIGTGFLTTYQLLPVLCDYGQVDTAYEVLENTKCPGWLYEVEKGATTIWENWLGIDENNVPRDSLNHYAMGAVAAWMYKYCAGIRSADVAFRKIQIRPVPGGSLTWVHASYDSIQGKIVSEWKIENGIFRIHVEVPQGIDCELVLPDGSTQKISRICDAACPWKK